MHWISVQASSEIMLPVCSFIFAILLSFYHPTNERIVCIASHCIASRWCWHRTYIPLQWSQLSRLHIYILAYMWKTCIKKNYTVRPSCLFPPFRCISFSLQPSAFNPLQLLQLLLHFYHIACTHMCIYTVCIRVRSYVYIYICSERGKILRVPRDYTYTLHWYMIVWSTNHVRTRTRTRTCMQISLVWSK